MIHQFALSIASVLMLGLSQGTTQAPPQPAPAQKAPEPSTGRLGKIEAAIAHPGRTPANVARDRYRNPAATLNFFEVDPNDTVVEIWPGGGWYTEILAPYLTAGGGKLYAAAPDWGRSGLTKLQTGRRQAVRFDRDRRFSGIRRGREARSGRHCRRRSDVSQRPQLAHGISARRQAGL